MLHRVYGHEFPDGDAELIEELDRKLVATIASAQGERRFDLLHACCAPADGAAAAQEEKAPLRGPLGGAYWD